MRARDRTTGLLAVLFALLLAALVPAATPAHADGEADRPVVRVGTEGTYPPFSYKPSGSGDLTGYDIDVIEAVAEEAGWDLRFEEGTFDALFPALDSNRIDVIANQVTINPEREARYLFTEPYTYSRGVIVTAADNDDITSLDDLDGQVAAQSETSNWAQVARDAGAEVQSVEGFAQAAELLVQGRVDVIVNDNIAVLDYLASTGSDDIKIVGETDDEVSRQAFVFRQSDPDLQRAADEALATLAEDGTLAEISEGYFTTDVSVEEQDGEIAVEGSNSGRSTREVIADEVGPMLLELVRTNIPLTLISFAVGLLIALAVAMARMSSLLVLSLPARIYISIIRGTPLLVQLFIVFYGLPQVGIKLPGFLAACLALSLNVGGYAAEIIRGSILSVPRGQFEAATTIGMRYPQLMRRIVLPQASRIAVPPLSNTLLSLVKDTSLVSVVLVTDMFRVAQNAASVSGQFLPLYVIAALYFWVVCFLLSLGQERLEKKLGRYVA
ncbi:ABC transporter substrate-binding protein/permease [Nocardioides dongxiaopingii]|uniref:ABC transporter substrate-binding protein/permease n=1 Tax=Nocardioides sp. S-1144 TaxID=2582905 RepID=UPI00110D813E|nr:ABC transporter substrate-binding protein/permease [Nocardioides sp. S-1144]QCW49815.1 ABC transporter substrate-binding protein/permease [Nocardioides sp. S-1144]